MSDAAAAAAPSEREQVLEQYRAKIRKFEDTREIHKMLATLCAVYLILLRQK